MVDFNNIISKLLLAKMLKKRCEDGNLSHAYLFISPDEEYLVGFCNWFASEILKNKVKVESRTHPDLVSIDENKLISVEMVTPIVSDVYMTPYEAEYKVYLIKDASVMTDEAQNKLLKTIEEPPEKVIIILGASSANTLLTTILSRVAKFNLEPLSEHDISNLLVLSGVGENLASVYASCSGGNFTHAKNLSLDSEFIDLFLLVLEMFKTVNGSKDILKFLSKFNFQKFSLLEFFDLTISVARDIIALEAEQLNLVVNKSNISHLKECAVGFNVVSLVKIIELAIEARKDLTFNANNQAVLDEFLLKMVEAKVTCKK